MAQIIMTPTDKIVEIDSLSCRIWVGRLKNEAPIEVITLVPLVIPLTEKADYLIKPLLTKMSDEEKAAMEEKVLPIINDMDFTPIDDDIIKGNKS